MDEKHALYRFIVRDTGIGMSEAFQKRMFELFSQEDGEKGVSALLNVAPGTDREKMNRKKAPLLTGKISRGFVVSGFFQCLDSENHQNRENDGCQDSHAEVIAEGAGNHTGKGRTAGAAEVSGQSQEGKHGGSAVSHGSGSFAEGSGPHDADGETADGAARQAQSRNREKGDAEIGENTEESAVFHEFIQIDTVAVFSIKSSGDSHEKGEGHGTGQVADGLADTKAPFSEGGGPLAHGLFAGSGAQHHQEEDPENFHGEKLLHGKSGFTFFDDGSDGRPGENQGVEDRNDGPDQSQQFPVGDSGQFEENGGDQHHAHMAPAVKGMEKAHGLFLVVCGTGLHDRTDEHLDEASAHGIDHDGDQNTDERITQKIRQDREKDQPGSSADMGCQNGDPVADAIHEFRGEQVHDELDAEIHRHKHRDFGQRNVISALEGQKKKGNKVVYNGLNDVPQKTGIDGFLISVFHKKAS